MWHYLTWNTCPHVTLTGHGSQSWTIVTLSLNSPRSNGTQALTIIVPEFIFISFATIRIKWWERNGFHPLYLPLSIVIKAMDPTDPGPTKPFYRFPCVIGKPLSFHAICLTNFGHSIDGTLERKSLCSRTKSISGGIIKSVLVCFSFPAPLPRYLLGLFYQPSTTKNTKKWR